MENYFWNTEETQSVKKLYVLIIYDIVDNKKRLAFDKKTEWIWIQGTEISI